MCPEVSPPSASSRRRQQHTSRTCIRGVSRPASEVSPNPQSLAQALESVTEVSHR